MLAKKTPAAKPPEVLVRPKSLHKVFSQVLGHGDEGLGAARLGDEGESFAQNQKAGEQDGTEPQLRSEGEQRDGDGVRGAL